MGVSSGRWLRKQSRSSSLARDEVEHVFHIGEDDGSGGEFAF